MPARHMSMRRFGLAAFTAGSVMLAACGGSDSSTDATDATDAAVTTAAPDTAPPPTDAATTTAAPTTVAEPVVAFQPTDTGFAIDWSALAGPPSFSHTAGADPYYLIHTKPAVDGFFLSLEMYTVYGTQWTGQLGTFDIGCSASSTGICAHFDPDGPGPLGDLGADFLATGSVTINQLDAEGYDIVVDELVFSDGTTITGVHMVGVV
ncbi:MAG: hypothetical protein HY826_04435 [Actinobacteria bacterium]|nr:hypothetical protein [Actinomycetota bacterium]